MKWMYLCLIITLFLSCASGVKDPSANSNVAANEPSTGQNAKLESPDITVRVNGFTTGKGTLIGIFTEQQYLLDTALIDASGTMNFKRTEPYQPGLAFILLPDQSFFQLLIDADQTFTLSTHRNDLVKEMQVEGSIDNEMLYENLKFEADHQPKVNAVNAKLKSFLPLSPEYAQLEVERDALIAERKDHLQGLFDEHPNTLFTSFKTAGQNPDIKDVRKDDGTLDSVKQLYLYRSEFWDNVDFSDERLLYTPVISNKLKRYITELTPQIADSINAASTLLAEKTSNHPEYFKYFVNWITLKYEPGNTTLMDGEAVYAHMVNNYFTYQKAFWSDSFEIYSLHRRAKEMEKSLVGMDGPIVEAKDLNGEMRSIADIQSPYVVVFIFNPTCEHCIEESPKLVGFYNQWKNKGVEVYAIAVDTNDDEWQKFIYDNGMDQWINVYDPTNAAIYGKYFVDNTPEVYVLNPDRKIIAKNLKIDQIADMIRRDKK